MYTLQELWRGNITPSERFVRAGSEYKKIAGKLSDEMDRLMDVNATLILDHSDTEKVYH